MDICVRLTTEYGNITTLKWKRHSWNPHPELSQIGTHYRKSEDPRHMDLWGQCLGVANSLPLDRENKKLKSSATLYKAPADPYLEHAVPARAPKLSRSTIAWPPPTHTRTHFASPWWPRPPPWKMAHTVIPFLKEAKDKKVQRRSNKTNSRIRGFEYYNRFSTLWLFSLRSGRARRDLIKTMKELSRVSRTSGLLFFSDGNSAHRWRKLEQLKPKFNKIIRVQFFAVGVTNCRKNFL